MFKIRLKNCIYGQRRSERFLKSIWIGFYWEFVQCRPQCSLLTGESSDQAFAVPIAHSNTFLRGSLRAKQALLKSVKLRVESGAVVVKTWNLLPWLWLKCSLQLVKLSISTGKTSNKRGKYEEKVFSLDPCEEIFYFFVVLFSSLQHFQSGPLVTVNLCCRLGHCSLQSLSHWFL